MARGMLNNFRDDAEALMFMLSVDELSPNLQSKIYTTLSTHPHLRGLDLIGQIEKSLTLAEQSEAEAWLRGLSAEDKRALRGG